MSTRNMVIDGRSGKGLDGLGGGWRQCGKGPTIREEKGSVGEEGVAEEEGCCQLREVPEEGKDECCVCGGHGWVAMRRKG